MRTPWAQLAGLAPGQRIEIEGWLAPLPEGVAPGYGLLTAEPACCCPPSPASTIEVLAPAPLPVSRGGRVRVAGLWQALPEDDPSGWRWQLTGAEVLAASAPGPWLSRRRALGGLACLAVSAAGCAPQAAPETQERGRALALASTPMDLHSHAGGVILSDRFQRPASPIAEPMRQGGVRLVALAMVADAPLTQLIPGGRIQATREPRAGEMREYAEHAFARLHGLVERQSLALVTDQASLRAAMAPGAAPAVLVSAEGGDFLEGSTEKLRAAFATHRLRNLQLVHYRVNELGDIQTEDPVHNGLTSAGRAMVRECERLGVLVDVAHATLATVQGVLEVATKPIVLSHTSLLANPSRTSRMIRAEHGRLVARTGGVVGVWPLLGMFPSMRAYAEGIARMAEAIGVAHVGVGTDMLGLPGGATLESYRDFPALAAELLAVGFSEADAAALLGGNFARVLGQVLPA